MHSPLSAALLYDRLVWPSAVLALSGWALAAGHRHCSCCCPDDADFFFYCCVVMAIIPLCRLELYGSTLYVCLSQPPRTVLSLSFFLSLPSDSLSLSLPSVGLSSDSCNLLFHRSPFSAAAVRVLNCTSVLSYTTATTTSTSVFLPV